MTSPQQRRRMLDLEKVQRLAQRSRGRIAVTRTEGNPLHCIEVWIDAVTADSPAYPATKRRGVKAEIVLPARFPFEPPSVRITTPILHPNVWIGGAVCLGAKWLPTEGLDLLVRRLVAIVTFDPHVVSPDSAANPAAAQWFVDARRRQPSAFPSDRLAEALR